LPVPAGRVGGMLERIVAATIRFCARRPWWVIAVAVVIAAAARTFAATHFSITTDVNRLISPDIPWRQREARFEKAFPGHYSSILIVVEGPTVEDVSAASGELVERLRKNKQLFHSVDNLAGSEFFARNGLLFRPLDQVRAFTQGLGRAEPVIAALADDPSLRGVAHAMVLTLGGVQRQMTTLDALVRPMTMAADTVEAALAGRSVPFSWQAMLNGRPPDRDERRNLIEVIPVLDFTSLEPGKAASDAIRQAATDLDLAGKFQTRVRLTGPVPMSDEEFGSLKQGAAVNAIATALIVLCILWLALKSARLIFAVLVNLVVGLSITAALGLLMVQSLNLISVAFAVLFVGLGVDFGIQFSVRLRAEHHEAGDLPIALQRTAHKIAVPLTLAAVAVAAGFMSFLPTVYRGVSELGLIAGAGMLIAYATSITLLPALIAVLKPPGEAEPIGYRALAPVDRFLRDHRVGVIAGTLAVVILGLPLLKFLSFDFDPIHLRDPSTESISTLRDLGSDPRLGLNSINVVVPSLEAAPDAIKRLQALPQVAETRSLSSFVPSDQGAKLAAIAQFRKQLGPALGETPSEAPSDADNVEALQLLSQRLHALASGNGPGAKAAQRLGNDAAQLAKADTATRNRAQDDFVVPLRIDLAALSAFTQAELITATNLPQNLRQQWILSNGEARIEVLPKGDTNSTDVLRQFATAVTTVYPNAVGVPISILESGRTVVHAFFEAAIYALISIAILLWIVLRRLSDVVLTLLPLIVAGVLTLEVCVIIGMPLNFANIIALPLLLGVGVAFKIYYIVAWRAGQTDLLQSSLTRAVIWSALATATAFGSLWLSNHPGTSSMGKLLALSLICTLAAAVLFQPALMGRPRNSGN
jgi:hopanoid biosynthesis associated RND transporter like protein HpnN